MKDQPFSAIFGNDHIKDYLTNTVNKQAIGNSLLFAGPDGIGKSLFAESFAKLILRTDREASRHPDIYVYRPEGKLGMHSIDSMRHFSEKVYLAPFESKWKVFIIHDAERMLPSSSNALLKTFEEPAKDSIIILLSSAPSMLLPTVLSRCRTLRFHAVQEDLVARFLIERNGMDEPEATKLAALAQGSIGRALRMAEEPNDTIRKRVIEFLARGRFNTYAELIEAAKQLSTQVEESKKLEEGGIRSQLLKGLPTELTAAQQQALDKEIDGAVALKQTELSQSLFEIILSWYRDMQLLSSEADHRLLMNRESIHELKQAIAQSRILPIEAVQKALSEAKVLIERSTAIQIVLENLFLKLNFL